jgi:CBS domain containing-hemolysin-like protein
VASTPADQLLARLKRDRIHSSLVVDEFGGTLGFVTLDDVIAEVMDEELGDGADGAVRDSDGSLVVDGEVTLNELQEDHGITLTHPEVTTIARCGPCRARHRPAPASA